MAQTIAGLVLAGGSSRRMGGGEKFLLDLAGRPMLAHIIDRILPQTNSLAISANCDPQLLSAFPFAVLADAPPAGRGPLAGILSGLDWAAATKPEIAHLVTVASDTPFFPADLVVTLAGAGKLENIVLASSAGRIHPTFGLWPLSAREALRGWLRDERSLKVTDFVEAQSWSAADFDIEADGDPFFNVNTLQDLDVAIKRAGATGP